MKISGLFIFYTVHKNHIYLHDTKHFGRFQKHKKSLIWRNLSTNKTNTL